MKDVGDNHMERITQRSYDLPVAVESYTHDQLAPLEEYVIARELPPGGRLLELGCGAGRLTGRLRQPGRELVACDIAPNMLARARARFPDVHFECCDAAQLPFADAEFDAVFFGFNGLDCLLPFARREQCLREMRRALKPGGTLLFSSHNKWWPGAYLPTNRFRAGTLRDNLLRGFLWRDFRYERHAGGQEFYFAVIAPPRQLRDLRRLGFAGARLIDPFCPRGLRYIWSRHPYYRAVKA